MARGPAGPINAMVLELPFLGKHSPFPAVSTALASPNGLLAYGGDLTPTRLLDAYAHGIFPWYSDNEPILWWSPDPRAIILPDQLVVSRSLRKVIRQRRYRITLNQAFADVIEACASVPRKQPGEEGTSYDTWITGEMQNAYIDLHENGFAHSVEVWDNNTLAGGLYGVAVGDVFCGESMFHLQSNASKVALYALNEHMRSHDMAFIDCQMPTDHLSSLGAITINRENFIQLLYQHRQMHEQDGSVSLSYRACWQAGDITP